MTNDQPEAVLESAIITSPLYKYAAALMGIALAVLSAFLILPADSFASVEAGVPAALSLLAVALGAVGIWGAKLLGPRGSSILKVIVAIGSGVLASVIQFVAAGDFSAQGIAFLAFAVLSGIATKIGVDIRKDAQALAA